MVALALPRLAAVAAVPRLYSSTAKSRSSRREVEDLPATAGIGETRRLPLQATVRMDIIGGEGRVDKVARVEREVAAPFQDREEAEVVCGVTD